MSPFLKTLFKAIALGLGIGALLGLLNATGDWRLGVLISVIFSVVIWCGFELLSPWTRAKSNDSNAPSRTALIGMLKIMGAYLFLLGLALLLAWLATGVNLFYPLALALFTFLIGFAVTAFVTGLHTAANLVTMEREKAKIEIDAARKTGELEAARRLQLSMIPVIPPQLPGIQIAFAMRTATEVGGDFYDYRKMQDGSTLIAFGDATGHGIEAALILTAVKSLFQTLPICSLPESMQRISEGVRGLGLKRMNMALTLMRVEELRVTAAIAGMPPILHWQAHEERVAEHAAKTPPLGQLRHMSIQETEIQLRSKDRLLLCSDGLPECMDPKGELFGYKELAPRLRAHRSLSPQACVDALNQDADRWSMGRALEDDLSLWVMATE
jgi:Stage II sporulation protein E (SpoIIE)